MGIPYTGSGVMASALGMDKWRSKLLWQAQACRCPSTAARSGSDLARVEAELGLPLFVKPACEGSSIGISKVSGPASWRRLCRSCPHDSLVIAERAILGGEYTVAILGERRCRSSRSSRAPSSTTTRPSTCATTPLTAVLAVCRKARKASLRAQALEAFPDPWRPRLGAGRLPDG
jgi:D-alanine-D-alanine ligase